MDVSIRYYKTDTDVSQESEYILPNAIGIIHGSGTLGSVPAGKRLLHKSSMYFDWLNFGNQNFKDAWCCIELKNKQRFKTEASIVQKRYIGCFPDLRHHIYHEYDRRCITHFKSDWIKNMDHIGISGTEVCQEYGKTGSDTWYTVK